MTYDEILKRTLARVTANVDKSEGSLIFDAISPCCLELAQCYSYIEELEKRVFADTSYGEYLDRRTAERGINRKPAVQSVRKGTFNIPVPIGSRWAKEELTFLVVERITGNQYKLQCNQFGSIGNQYDGQLVNMDFIEGLNSAILGEIITAGVDAESDESLRFRYFESFDQEAFGGNVKDYEEQVGEIEGVGQVKVYPVWNGAGTVKVAIVDSQHNEPTSELVETVQTLVDPTQNAGEGLGIAPIGHIVTVVGASGYDVEVSLELVLEGTTWEYVEPVIVEVIEKYFNDLRSKWSQADIIVRTSQIESRVLDVAGVIDVTSTLLNAQGENIILDEAQVPRLTGVVNT